MQRQRQNSFNWMNVERLKKCAEDAIALFRKKLEDKDYKDDVEKVDIERNIRAHERWLERYDAELQRSRPRWMRT